MRHRVPPDGFPSVGHRGSVAEAEVAHRPGEVPDSSPCGERRDADPTGRRRQRPDCDSDCIAAVAKLGWRDERDVIPDGLETGGVPQQVQMGMPCADEQQPFGSGLPVPAHSVHSVTVTPRQKARYPAIGTAAPSG